ncbi:MAG: system NifU family Fe-S cluster assembly protein [Acidobacteria bacterium]|jgi:nitrogen fixation NifU-like protein|nr:system NifU family Fe-S cluster assembly protein [Acidobacteriota bacterium]
MPDLRELYQQVILDHHKKPRNRRRPGDANKHAEGFNPLCGDKVSVFLRIENGVIRDIAFEGSGCAISTASASMMTESLKGKTEAEAEGFFERFHDLVTGKTPAGSDVSGLGKLAVFAGVREYPVRVKCATLAWHTMRAAMEEREETVATE